MVITSVAVFCGSKSGNNPLYELHAKQLGKILAEKNIKVIYGGGNKGIMGAIANAIMEMNGHVTGIIPTLLTELEAQHLGITELIIVDNMHSRKKVIYDKCDAAIILPGGLGTLDELFEILTWNQLNIHNKKIFLLNSAGFYDHLIAHARIMEKEGFLYDSFVNKITTVSTPQEFEHFL